MQLTKVILHQITILTPTLTTPVGEITQTLRGDKMTKIPKVTQTLIDQIRVMVTKGIVLMHNQNPILN